MCRDAYVWCVVVIKGKGRVERLDAYSSLITINKSVSGGSEHFPGGSDGKESACKMGEPGSIPVYMNLSSAKDFLILYLLHYLPQMSSL